MKRAVPHSVVRSFSDSTRRSVGSVGARPSSGPNEFARSGPRRVEPSSSCRVEPSATGDGGFVLSRMCRAIPKSPSLMRRHLDTRKFGGLMSRWTTMCGRRPWRYSTARAMSTQNDSDVLRPGRSRGTYASRLPLSKSSTTSARPGTCAQPRNCAMLGWWSRAMSRISFLNMSQSSTVESWKSTLTATGVLCHRARRTVPNAPAPMTRPTTSASASMRNASTVLSPSVAVSGSESMDNAMSSWGRPGDSGGLSNGFGSLDHFISSTMHDDGAAASASSREGEATPRGLIVRVALRGERVKRCMSLSQFSQSDFCRPRCNLF
mmetsp:Transcript_27671/g.85529  ORF Transcript_27671/g.85529 Transcript_27671/m.85529 type:complete len:321 (-) Transcript_27671:99-1061(-)